LTLQSRRRHQRTGLPRDGHPGNRYAFVTGWRSRKTTVPWRKEMNRLIRAAREAMREG
jgi:hypothetical protein